MYDSAKSYLIENVSVNYKKAASSSALNTKDCNVLLQQFCEDLCEMATNKGRKVFQHLFSFCIYFAQQLLKVNCIKFKIF